MKFLLGAIIGIAAGKPLLKVADKYVGKSYKVKAAEKVASTLLSLHHRANDYLKDNI